MNSIPDTLEPVARKWWQKNSHKYGDPVLHAHQIARLYYQTHGGTIQKFELKPDGTKIEKTIPNKWVTGQPQQAKPNHALPCPLCGKEMFPFNLCSKCDEFKQGYRTRWICLQSEGMLIPVATGSPQTWKDWYVQKEGKELVIVCKQQPILDPNDYD